MNSTEHGAFWIDIEHTDVRFPTGYWGDNGDTAVAGSIFYTPSATRCIVYGLYIYANAAGGTITIYGMDGTTVLKTCPVAAGVTSGTTIEFGANGLELPPMNIDVSGNTVPVTGFAVKTSVGTLKASVLFYTNVSTLQ